VSLDLIHPLIGYGSDMRWQRYKIPSGRCSKAAISLAIACKDQKITSSLMNAAMLVISNVILRKNSKVRMKRSNVKVKLSIS
jgi:hypothetical protein